MVAFMLLADLVRGKNVALYATRRRVAPERHAVSRCSVHVPAHIALILIVSRGAGAGIGGDCAPGNSNHNRFYAAAPSVAWAVEVTDAGHFQFLDHQTTLQQAVCLQVRAPRGLVGVLGNT